MTSQAKRITGRAIIVHDGKILLMERWRDGLHYFSIPGGGVEPGETNEQAAIREIAEEMSVEVEVVRKLFVAETADSMHHIYLCRYVSGEPSLAPDSEEARDHAGGSNLFKPSWVPLESLGDLPFEYWEFMRPYLAEGIKQGFSDVTKTIRA
jgi:8-oxo-dGTP diphosphatase